MLDQSKIVFLKKEKIAKDTWRFHFQNEKSFSFIPGQYLSIFLDNDFRDFTISSSPLKEKEFTIVTKVGKSEFKKKLFSLPIKSTIKIKNPAGGFILREKEKTPHIFLAGGIGVTPFYSMIKFAHEKKLTIPIMLFVSFSKKEDMIFYKELMEISRKDQQIKVIYTLSQENWEGEQGRISEILIKKYVPKDKDIQYLIAGGEAMVEDTEELLLRMGINSQKIRIDIFTGY